MKWINAALTGLSGLLLAPFRGIGPVWALVIVSAVTGVLLLWVFGKVSDQSTIRTLRDRVRGNLIGIRLFGDDLGTLFKLQVRLLRDNLVYVRYALLPMLIMLVPVLLVIVQLNLHFANRALEPGTSTTLTATLRDADRVMSGVSLHVPSGVEIESPAVRIPGRSQVSWRVRALEPGRHDVHVTVDDESQFKQIVVGDEWTAVSPRRPGAGFFDALLWPGESPLPSSSAFESIEVRHEALPLRAFGFGLNWLVVFFVLSVAVGFLFRGTLGVEI